MSGRERQLSAAEAEQVIRNTFADLSGVGRRPKGGIQMRGHSELLMTQDGRPSKAEANIRVGILQGRILPEDAEHWRDRYVEDGYESTTQQLLRHRPGSHSASPTEQQWEQYKRMSFIRDW
jgi:hypothetical protein